MAVLCEECGKRIPDGQAHVYAGQLYCDVCHQQLVDSMERTQPSSEPIGTRASPASGRPGRNAERFGLPLEFFHSRDEHPVAILGQGYVASLVSSGQLSSAVMVLTDQRIYLVGKMFEKPVGGRLTWTHGKQTLSVRDVTGTGYREMNPLTLLVTGLLLLVGLALGPMGMVLAVGGILLIIAYFLRRTKLLYVDYAGGSMGVDCKWYSQAELDGFLRSISQQKDRIMAAEPHRR